MKRILSVIFCMLIVAVSALPCMALGTVDSVDAPYSVKYGVHSDGTNERITVSCLFTDKFSQMTAYPPDGVSSIFGFVQLDYRIDGGEWQYSPAWDTQPELPAYSAILEAGTTGRMIDVMYLVNESSVKQAGELVVVHEDGKKTFDLENHSLEVRLRCGVGYQSAGNLITKSEWSETVLIERNAPQQERPTEFEAPQVSDFRVLYHESDEMPYFAFDVKTPESVKIAQSIYQAYDTNTLQLKCYANYGDGWTEVSFSPVNGTLSDGTKTVNLKPSVFDDEKLVKFKLNYLIYGKDDVPIFSEESEVFRLTSPRWEEGKGVLHAKCTTCGICKPIFGKCMFFVLGIAAVILVVLAVVVKMAVDKANVRKAEQEAEKQRKIQAEKEAYNAKKQANKQKNKKK